MEYTSQSALHFPAAYAPISEDEMIYLDGGDAISPQQFTFNLVTNLIRLMGQAAFSGALNGLSNMSNDGLTTGGAIAHYWNRQNTLGKVATVVFTGFAGYAVYIYCVSLVNNVLNLYTSAKNSITGADKTTTDTTALLDKLDHNEVDMLCTMDDHVYDTNYVIADEEEIGVHFVASPAHPLASLNRVEIRQLLEEPFLLTEKGMSYRRLMDEQLARSSLEIRPVLETGQADVICTLVGQNMGLSFLPDYVTEDMVGHKLGEFAPTRTFRGHAGSKTSNSGK